MYEEAAKVMCEIEVQWLRTVHGWWWIEMVASDTEAEAGSVAIGTEAKGSVAIGTEAKGSVAIGTEAEGSVAIVTVAIVPICQRRRQVPFGRNAYAMCRKCRLLPEQLPIQGSLCGYREASLWIVWRL